VAANKDPGVPGPSPDAAAGMIGDIFTGIGNIIGGLAPGAAPAPTVPPPAPVPVASGPVVPTWVWGVALGLAAIGVGRAVLK
jgi:hypothetical protein